MRKVRTYLDCIEVLTDSDGLNYTANFRYYNPNSYPIYVLEGPENELVGQGDFIGQVPIVFLPGEGVFDVRFDGQKLVWNLTTFDSTHKTSISTEATSSSGKCDAKYDGTSIEDSSYLVGPVPFKDSLTIERTVYETGTVDVFNIYGILQSTESFSKNDEDAINIDTSLYADGIYVVRITTSDGIYSQTVIRQ